MRALGEAGHRSCVLSFDAWRPARGSAEALAQPRVERGAHCDVMRIKGPEGLDAARAFALSCSPDLVHVHHGMLWGFAEEVSAEAGLPTIFMVHVHQAMMNRLRGVSEPTASLSGQEKALAAADRVLTPSAACARALSKEHPTLQLMSAPLGAFDSEQARRAAKERPPQEREELLYVGRFGDVKGTREFFEIASALLARRPKLKVRVVGGVPANAKAERRWLRRWQALCPPGCESRVSFEGWTSPEALSVHYAAASVLVVPSWTETFGLTLLEGMLHGRAIVASACPALVELVGHGNELVREKLP